MDRTLIAHAISRDEDERAALLAAMYLEVGWGLGRNPMNLIQMTTATSPLAHERSFTEACFPSRYVYSHNEFTPRQTMRGKMALYAYPWGLGKQRIADRFPLHLYLSAILQAGKQR